MECAFLLCSPMFMVCVCAMSDVFFFPLRIRASGHSAYFYANARRPMPNAQCQWSAIASTPPFPSPVHFVHLPSVVCGQLQSIVQMGFLRVPHARALMCILCRCCNFRNALCSFKPKIRCQCQHCFKKTYPIYKYICTYICIFIISQVCLSAIHLYLRYYNS